MPKVLCPYHQEDTPSMEVYDDHAYCFGCGKSVTLEQLRKDSDGAVDVARTVERLREPEDIAASLKRIQALPRATIRNLWLPTDATSYYLIWPAEAFYLRRYYAGGYYKPAGHKVPLYVAQQAQPRGTLLIVEGEFNAASVALAAHWETTVVSPGGAGNFYSAHGLGYLDYYLQFANQVLLADEDEAGATACIELAGKLRQHSANVSICLMKKKKHGGKGDANEILETQGREGLAKVLSKQYGILTA